MRAFVNRNYPSVTLAASLLIFFFGMGGMFLLVVALKPMAADFGWPRGVPSLAFSLQFVGSGVGGIVMGYWMDRRGVLEPVMLGALMIGSGAILSSWVSSEWQLYLIYGVMLGLFGQSTMYTPLMTNAMLWFRHNRGMAIGVVASGQSLAGVIWPPVFRYFNDTVGWRETFFWYGVLALVTMLPLTALLRRRPNLDEETGPATQPAAPGKLKGLGAPFPIPALGGMSSRTLQIALGAAIVGCCVAMSLPLGHVVAHANDVGHSMARGAEMLSIILAGSFISRVFGGYLVVDRLGGLVALLVFSGLQALGMLFYAFVDGLPALYLTSLLFGLGYGGINMCYPVIIRQFMPVKEVGRRTGMVTLFGALGMALGAWVGGAVFDAYGDYMYAFLFGFAFNVANLGIVSVLYLTYRGGSHGIEVRPAGA